MTRRLAYLAGMVLIYLALRALNKYQINTFQMPVCDNVRVASLEPQQLEARKSPVAQPPGEQLVSLQLDSPAHIRYGTAKIRQITVRTTLNGDSVKVAVPDQIATQPGAAPMSLIVRTDSAMCRVATQELYIGTP